MKKNIKILIVDDSKSQAEELKYLLETNNYKVQHANDGEEVLDMLKQKASDIIISDVVMPKTGGYEICKGIKSDENAVSKNFEYEDKARTERIEHLNTVLSAIRSVNQLIVQEKDRKTLIKKACENFIEVRDFQSVWVALFDDDGKIIDFAAKGGNIDISKPAENSLPDFFPYCFKEALKTDDIVLIGNVKTDCKDCPWLKLYKEGELGAMSTGLKSGGKCYGVINISLPVHYVTDKEYQSLFMEVAGDIAFALYSMELEEKHKQVEEALRKSEEQYRLITENTSDVISLQTLDMKASYTYISPSIKAMNGYEPKEMLGRSAFEFIHPDDKKKLLPLLKKYISYKLKNLITGKESVFSETIEFRSKNKSGNWIYIQSTGNIIEDQLLFVSRDITEHKWAEKKIKEKSHFLESLIQQSPLPTFVMDSKGFNVMVNEAFLKFYAVPNKEMILGRNALTEPANVSHGVVKYFKEALSGKIVEMPEIEFVSPYKNKKTITRSRMFPIVDTTDTLTNVVVMQEDITEQKQAEKELAKHREHLEELVKGRTRELEDKNKELERFNKLFIDREFRIKELRDEIKKMKEK